MKCASLWVRLHGTRVAGVLAMLGASVAAWGCGIPVPRTTRSVTIGTAAWTADSRQVIVAVDRSRFTEVAVWPLPVEPGPAQGPWKNEIYLVDVAGKAWPKKIAKGRGLQVCPGKAIMAYCQETGAPDGTVLWLTNYSTGKRWKIQAQFVGGYYFSPDGNWFYWITKGTHRLVATERPTDIRTVAKEFKDLEIQGWEAAGGWAEDSSLYYKLYKTGKEDYRWVRYRPPDWEMEELGKHEGVDFTRTQVPAVHRGIRSPDGLMVLNSVRKDGVENLVVEYADGATRQITHFSPPW